MFVGIFKVLIRYSFLFQCFSEVHSVRKARCHTEGNVFSFKSSLHWVRLLHDRQLRFQEIFHMKLLFQRLYLLKTSQI